MFNYRFVVGNASQGEGEHDRGGKTWSVSAPGRQLACCAGPKRE